MHIQRLAEHIVITVVKDNNDRAKCRDKKMKYEQGTGRKGSMGYLLVRSRGTNQEDEKRNTNESHYMYT